MKTHMLSLLNLLLSIAVCGCTSVRNVATTDNLPAPDAQMTAAALKKADERAVRNTTSQGALPINDEPNQPNEITSEKDGAKMRLIPAGEFEMGNSLEEGGDDERPVHTVYVGSFYIDVHEVTNAQYKQFMQETGHAAPAFWEDPDLNAPNHPVVGVSWYDAVAYCQWAGKRLPTEAEWEKAARGGLVGKRHSWCDESPEAFQCNFADKQAPDWANWADRSLDDGYQFTAPVGAYPRNGYGLFDMPGNVWEWCMDAYDPRAYASSPKDNPVAGGLIAFDNNDYTNVTTHRVHRGGSWLHPPGNLRVSNRNSLHPANASIYLGFRCAVRTHKVVGTLRVP